MRIFLSYAHADAKLAEKLGSRLQAKGFDVWNPAQDVLPGDNWALKAGDALKMSDAVVVLLSPDSVKSESVRREIQFALGDAKKEGRLFPVLARPTKEIPWIFGRRLFRVLDASQGLAKVSSGIAHVLRAEKAKRTRRVKTGRASRAGG